MSQVMGMFGLLDSPCYGRFSLGGRSETYKPFISLIFKFFSGHGKPWITETADTESDMGAQLYMFSMLLYYVHNIYHQLVAQCVYLLLMIALTCFSDSFQPSSGTYQVYRHVNCYVNILAASLENGRELWPKHVRATINNK
jgi:hypothetical protein